MSTDSRTITADILGQAVPATVITTRPEADYANGPREFFVVDVDGSRYCVTEDEIKPR